jgi:hypothetical protein
MAASKSSSRRPTDRLEVDAPVIAIANEAESPPAPGSRATSIVCCLRPAGGADGGAYNASGKKV